MQQHLRSMTQAVSRLGVNAKIATDSFATLARALRGESLIPPQRGDYVVVTDVRDRHYGRVSVVVWVDTPDSSGRTTVYVKLNPFSDGIHSQRPIDASCLRKLSEMEVIAEASR